MKFDSAAIAEAIGDGVLEQAVLELEAEPLIQGLSGLAINLTARCSVEASSLAVLVTSRASSPPASTSAAAASPPSPERAPMPGAAEAA